MLLRDSHSRRSFLAAASAAASLSIVSAKGQKIPVGLEMYSVRDVLAKDLMGTTTAVAKMGYQCLEYFAPYYSWSTDQAKEVRKLMDDHGIVCKSTHNGGNSFTPAGIDKAIELNKILGSDFVVLASAGRVDNLDGWKKVGETLTTAMDKLRPAGLRAGYHNHQLEFKAIDGTRPIEVIARNTPHDVMLQLDVGTCVEVGQDPVAWIKANPGRINCLHCKDWSQAKSYKVLFGEGDAPWKAIFEAAEDKGGVEYYLIEQEGYDLPSLEAVEKCLANFKKLHG